MNLLKAEYFLQTDTLMLARQLLGMQLFTCIDGIKTAGRIVETEAYLGETDRASHAYGGRRTRRTEAMYLPGGHAYVYLCYGIHHLFNIVTNKIDIPHAILIRAIEPTEGINHMLDRRQKSKADFSLTRGPGSLSRALGINTGFSGQKLQDTELFIMDNDSQLLWDDIASGPRIGVDYAGEDAKLPYRFFIKNNPYVSIAKTKILDN